MIFKDFFLKKRILRKNFHNFVYTNPPDWGRIGLSHILGEFHANYVAKHQEQA